MIVIGSVGIGLVAALLAASHLGSAAIASVRVPVFAMGAVLTLVGVVLRLWAVVELGDPFTVEVRVRPDQPVEESGTSGGSPIPPTRG